MLRAVFDTVVFVRAHIYPSNWAGQLVFERAGRYHLLVSAPLMAEYLDVLYRSSLRAKHPSINDISVERVIRIVGAAEVVTIDALPHFARDPKDAPVLATATAGRADYIVSEDHDLLDLHTYEGIPIVGAGAFLALLG
jgi:putative PIN family toxin of toxin-antitoxin system